MNSTNSEPKNLPKVEACRFCAGTIKDVHIVGEGEGGHRVICFSCEKKGPVCGTRIQALVEWNVMQLANVDTIAAPTMPPQSAMERVLSDRTVGILIVAGLSMMGIALLMWITP